MSFTTTLISRGRLLALSTLCGWAVLTGCAQQPTQPGQPAQRSAGNTSADYSSRQGREVFAATFATAVQQDEFYETTLGVPRSVASFGAFKEAMTALYTDPIVIDWLYNQLSRGRKRDEVFQELGARLFSGVLRLDDNQSMQMLTAMGDMMGRLTPEQCDLFQRPKDKDPKADNAMTKMLQWLAPDETRRFFGGLHQSIRAELTNAPLRPAPSREQFAAMFAALGKEVPGGLYKSSGSGCKDLNRIVAAVNRLEGPVRSHAITYMLYSMGLASRNKQGVA